MTGLLRRASWNLVDQVVSSGTNAVLSFLVAREVSQSAFGGFAVAFTVFSLLVGASRALSSSPLGIRFSGAATKDFTAASSTAAGSALALGVAGGALCAVTGLALGGDVGEALLALGVVLPGLLVQDAWRYVFFAAARPAAAALNDAVWAVVQIGAVIALLVVGVSTAGPLVLAWGLAALAAALLGARQARTRPTLRGAPAWLRDHRDVTRYLLAEYGTLQGAQQGALLLIAVLGSLEAIGALRAVQVLLGPTTILAVAGFSFAIPEFSRRASTMTSRQWMQGASILSSVVAGLGAVWGLVFILAPDALGSFLLGATWPDTSAILWPTVAGQFAAAMAVGPAAMLYAMERPRVTFAVHLVEAPLIVVGGVGGVLAAGAFGAACGFAIAFWAVLPVIWSRFRREVLARTTVPEPHRGAGVRG